HVIDDLSSGRWRISRGQFEFYWSEASRLAGNAGAPPIEKRRLTEISQFVWNDRVNHAEPQGYETEWIGNAPVLFIWRGPVEARRVLVLRPDSLVTGN